MSVNKYAQDVPPPHTSAQDKQNKMGIPTVTIIVCLTFIEMAIRSVSKKYISIGYIMTNQMLVPNVLYAQFYLQISTKNTSDLIHRNLRLIITILFG